MINWGKRMKEQSLIPNYHMFAQTDFFGSLSKGGKSAKKVGLPVGQACGKFEFGPIFRAFPVINQEVH
jgi:hypothetical protein